MRWLRATLAKRAAWRRQRSCAITFGWLWAGRRWGPAMSPPHGGCARRHPARGVLDAPRSTAARRAPRPRAQGRNDTIAKTLAAWNRALGAAGKEHEISDLRRQLEEMAQALADANAELERLAADAYREPLEKLDKALQNWEAENLRIKTGRCEVDCSFCVRGRPQRGSVGRVGPTRSGRSVGSTRVEPRLSGCQVLSGAVRRLSSCQVSGGCQACVRWLSSLSGCEDARTLVRLSGDCQVVRSSGCQVLSGVRCCQVMTSTDGHES